jgi:hypothetical protein
MLLEVNCCVHIALIDSSFSGASLPNITGHIHTKQGWIDAVIFGQWYLEARLAPGDQTVAHVATISDDGGYIWAGGSDD